MRPIQLLILLVALGAAGAAGLLAMNLATPEQTAAPVQMEAAPAMETEDVLVASADIGMGTQVKGDVLAWRTWPKEGLSEGYITRTMRPDAMTELEGTLARSPFLSGEPIKEAKLVRTDRGFLSAILPKGKRAVAVRVNAASTAGGFILPNDRVDIILIRQAVSGGNPISETILSNIRVLAIDQTVDEVQGEQRSVVAQDTATLELTPEQAELIIQAQQMGTISLILRSIEDLNVTAAEKQQEKPSGVRTVKFGVQSRIMANEVN
ncbi:Flp pilus assembly protein CpaB [Chthonobacter albigriseus]|uniref:Flp pilus assembly protein CpaB n=1 Tax=Chthonobacter albigriseus TaxID=1683161 RepID=UPI0015EFC40B|nr:Flp pilus assembly protein CpaB [Chthonobacter albigriseus]